MDDKTIGLLGLFGFLAFLALLAYLAFSSNHKQFVTEEDIEKARETIRRFEGA